MKRGVGLWALITVMLLALLAGPALARVIQGTDGDDNIFGTRKNDRISGLDGKDLLVGRPGDDRLFGNDGDDILIGGPGGDVLVGGKDRDILQGRQGGDKLDAVDRGQDFLNCGAGRDIAIVDPEDVVADNCERVQRVNTNASGG